MELNVLSMKLLTIAHRLRYVPSACSIQISLLITPDLIWCLPFGKKLTSFEYVEPNGKDVGLSVRKKAENVLATVDDRDKLQQIREKAAATRDKWVIHILLTDAAWYSLQKYHLYMDHTCRYFGLSSTGITYKSSAASGSGSYSSGIHYGSTQSSKEADTSSNSYRGKEWSNQSKGSISNFRSTRQMSRKNTNSATNYKPIKGERRHRR